jgi:hypothetical protein
MQTIQLGCLSDAARPDAGGANADVLTHTVNHRANSLQIRIPAAAPRVIRMANHVAKTRPFAAKLTPHCHKHSSSILKNLHKVNSLTKSFPFRTLIYEVLGGQGGMRFADLEALKRNKAILAPI